MKKTSIVLACLLMSCAAPEPRRKAQPTKLTSADVSKTVKADVKAEGGHEARERSKLDPEVVEKVKAIFIPVFKNDDKKAKLAYGRNHRFVPPVIQLALDLRFKNYEHALQVLTSFEKADEEKAFLEKIIKQKPKKLSDAICESVYKTSGPMNFAVTKEQKTWSLELESILAQAAAEAGPLHLQARLDADKDIAQIPCSPEACPTLTGEARKKIFTDTFFDKVRNSQRRDTFFITKSYPSALKLAQYQRNLSLVDILKLNDVVRADSDVKTKNHFVRRIKGIGRDIRVESLLSRLAGGQIWADEKDKEFVQRLRAVTTSFPLIAMATRLDNELASCHLPDLK